MFRFIRGLFGSERRNDNGGKTLRSLLLAVAVVLVFGWVTGVRSIHYSNSAGLVLDHFTGVPRLFTLMLGILFLSLGVSLGRRTLLAWRVVGVLMVLVVFQFFAQGIYFALTLTDTFDRVWAFGSQAVCAAIVLGVFVWWWLPRRKEFPS